MAARGTVAGTAEEPREPLKLFVGGVPAAATEADLLGHFARFGEVRSVVVMRDRGTGHGRGFGFVEFVDEDAAARALGDGDEHRICGRQVEVKRARSRPRRNHQDDRQPSTDRNLTYESKKLFIGGLRDDVTEEEFRAYFETFGAVTDAVVIYDSLTNRSRGFGFVTFDSEEAVSKVMRQGFHYLNGTKVEAKIAIPKDGHYYRNVRGGRSFGMRGGYVSYEDPMYQPYSLYNGYMPQPVPAYPFYPAPYFHPYVNVPGMMARPIPPLYGAYPQMHPGFHTVSRSGFGDPATFENVFNSGSGNEKVQTDADLQDVSTASIGTKLDNLKLGSQ